MPIKNKRSSPQRNQRIQELIEMGAEHEENNKHQLAQKSYLKALQLDPQATNALRLLGLSYLAENDLVQAEECIRHALSLTPNATELHHALGYIHQATGNNYDEIRCYKKALSLDESYAPAYIGIGCASLCEKNINDALTAFQHYLKLQPQCALGHIHMATALIENNQAQLALEYYQRALVIEPDNVQAKIHLALMYQRICYWEKLPDLLYDLKSIIKQQISARKKTCLAPMDSLYLFNDNKLQRKIEKNYARAYANNTKFNRRGYEFPLSMRLRIGYIVDEHKNDISLWLGDSLSLHREEKFESYVYAQSKNINPAIKQSCNVFTDVSNISYQQTANKIRGHKIQILIDLSGYSSISCLETLSYRPAPIQCHAFGYPGSIGSEHVDYQITSQQVVSKKIAKKYTEKMLYLDKVPFSAAKLEEKITKVSRLMLALPEDKFIFCYLNPYQWIDEKTFSAWCKILAQSPNSVLWLMIDDPLLKDNLCQKLQQAHLSTDRLVITPIESLSKRWCLQAADLWLDNFNHSSPTSIMLAHWIGLPYLTLMGDSQQSRLAGSYALAAKLNILTVESVSAYIQQAVTFSKQPETLQSLSQQMLNTRNTTPLFDNKHFIKQLEKAYILIWQRFQAGKLADSLSVE